MHVLAPGLNREFRGVVYGDGGAFKSSLVGYCDVGGKKKLESVQCGVEHRLGVAQSSSSPNSHSRTVGVQIGKQEYFSLPGDPALGHHIRTCHLLGCACNQGSRLLPVQGWL